jgi:hypothetical protein
MVNHFFVKHLYILVDCGWEDIYPGKIFVMGTTMRANG